LDFKAAVKKFVGIKTHEELKVEENKTSGQKTKEFIKSMLQSALAALVIITFVIQNTRIPTGSMESTILVGDFVLVNKFIYGPSSPKYIPFTQIELPYFSLPSVREPKAGDIVVFEYPGDRDDLVQKELNVSYVKRLIGMPGDTIRIIDKVVYINRKEAPIPPHVLYLDYQVIPEGYIMPGVFPEGKPWNKDQYGPLVIPKKGSSIQMTLQNAIGFRTVIDREHGKRVVSIQNGKVLIEGKPVESYTFKKDYYFMMGDSRDNSEDSRFWGFVPRDMITGQAFMVLFSWDRDIPFSEPIKLLSSIRPDRILNLID